MISATNLKQCGNECERILCNAYSYGWVEYNINYIIFHIKAFKAPRILCVFGLISGKLHYVLPGVRLLFCDSVM